QRLDPPLLPQRERDEEAELDQLGVREVLVQLRPQRLVRDLRVPDDRARVGEGHLLTLGEFRRIGEEQEIVVFLFRQPFPSGLDGALYPSVLALDGLGDVDAAELFDGMIADALPERQLPGLRERADHTRVVGADRLALRPGRPFATRALQIAQDLRVGDRRRVDIGNMGHRALLSRSTLLPHALAAEATLPARAYLLVVDVA